MAAVRRLAEARGHQLAAGTGDVLRDTVSCQLRQVRGEASALGGRERRQAPGVAVLRHGGAKTAAQTIWVVGMPPIGLHRLAGNRLFGGELLDTLLKRPPRDLE